MTNTAQQMNVQEREGGHAAISPEESQQPLTRQQASDYLRDRWGLSYAAHTLALYAVKGTGPEYSKAGPRAMYTREALDEFAKTKLTGPSKKASDLKPIMETENGNA
jgi:hypothetical protein